VNTQVLPRFRTGNSFPKSSIGDKSFAALTLLSKPQSRRNIRATSPAANFVGYVHVGSAKSGGRDQMRLLNLSSIAFLAIAVPGIAFAQPCPGVFIRDSQSYDNTGEADTLVKVDVIIPKGTRDTIVGYEIVEGRKYYRQYRAFLHDPADIRLKAGCKLGKY
jgi:hypothetical protein